MKRLAPAAFAAATRLRVPSMRMRALRGYWAASCVSSNTRGKSVSWCMTMSGRAATTARFNPSASYTSATADVTPTALRSRAASTERVMPVTSWPAARKSGVNRRPMAPLAPARNSLTAIISRRTLRAVRQVLISRLIDYYSVFLVMKDFTINQSVDSSRYSLWGGIKFFSNIFMNILWPRLHRQ